MGSIVEGAQLAGKLTGIVTTTRVTHATPAAFSTHVRDRNDENEIAMQQILSLDLNVLMGGGRRHFDPQSTAGSKRKDELDLVAAARTHGYAVATDAGTMRRVATAVRRAEEERDARASGEDRSGGDDDDPSTLPRSMRAILGPRMLGLFAPSHLPYEIDRHRGFIHAAAAPALPPPASTAAAADAAAATDAQPPALVEMTVAALEVLATGPHGFFLLVEAGRIDHGGHANDAGAALAEVCPCDSTLKPYTQKILHPKSPTPKRSYTHKALHPKYPTFQIRYLEP